ncbi:ATP-grasp fold amidoligase family protein [Plantibacter sp. LMC-P-059a]|uniref:ATP-grasp fold amidoligase family protein n=1 Tax=Plantibacter sp. LMC-P-059a TaxID=3040297 RepID=UPI00254FFDB6|nr:ATP-grasp fold amidoligase family protein [Plantibacter sp. LMC-P-059a]
MTIETTDLETVTVDVVVPVKDDAALLRRCLRSLRAQDTRPASIIVVDNGSLDRAEVAAITERYGAVLIDEPVPGIPAANAAGFDRATATVVARLDADCVPPPDWLTRIAEAFRAEPELDALTGPATFIDGPRPLRAPLAAVYLGAYRLFVGAALAQTPIFGSNCAIRRATWDEIAHAVHRHDAELHDDLDVSAHLGLDRRVRYDRELGMGMSMRPFSDAASLAVRLRRGWATLRVHWPQELPIVRWAHHTTRLHAAVTAAPTGSSSVRWRERSALVLAARRWRTRRPQTFREKVRYKMLRDRRPMIVTFADKAAVREYVASRIGSSALPQAYGVLDDPRALRELDLPASYVVKPTHGSGAAIVVSPAASPDTRLPTEPGSWVYRHVRPEAVTREALVSIADGWVAQLYGQGPNREWVYGQVPRRIIVEELLTGPDGGIPDDYKLFVFHGRCRYIQVDAGRFGRRTQDFFRPDWSHLPMSGGPPWADPEPQAPQRLDEMIRMAERLAEGTDFVRVDLYDLGDRIVFGELTSYPAGGDSPFDPESYNAEFGSWWTVPRRYR